MTVFVEVRELAVRALVRVQLNTEGWSVVSVSLSVRHGVSSPPSPSAPSESDHQNRDPPRAIKTPPSLHKCLVRPEGVYAGECKVVS